MRALTPVHSTEVTKDRRVFQKEEVLTGGDIADMLGVKLAIEPDGYNGSSML